MSWQSSAARVKFNVRDTEISDLMHFHWDVLQRRPSPATYAARNYTSLHQDLQAVGVFAMRLRRSICSRPHSGAQLEFARIWRR